MGIVNLTPDSFSDGGVFNSFNAASDQLQNFINNGFEIIDVGAESTAPFNQAISADKEQNRLLEILLPWLELRKNSTERITLSIDTYKCETFKMVYDFVENHNLPFDLIFNDVSGKIDEELIATLQAKCPKAQYIYCHSLVPRRFMTSEHMNYLKNISNEEFFDHVIEYFQEAYKRFQELNLLNRVIFDPCFGFSKTREQNHYLLANFETLVKALPEKIHWLVGISRKSFLRYLEITDRRDSQLLTQVEYLQAMILSSMICNLPDHKLTFRLHDPLMKRCLEWFQRDMTLQY